jgi:hypothetical protein
MIAFARRSALHYLFREFYFWEKVHNDVFVNPMRDELRLHFPSKAGV